MIRGTKIVATLGPATDDPKVLDEIIAAGVDVVRINFSHGSAEEHKQRCDIVRSRARAHGRQVGVMGDLQGPKIRIERFKEGKIHLNEGDAFALDTSLGRDEGDQEAVGLTYKSLVKDVKRGDILLLDDGQIVLWVDSVAGTRIECKVRVGGALSNNKGINRQGGGLSAGALTAKDMADLQTAAELDVDYLAISFPKSAADINLARQLLRDAGCNGSIVAKVERAEAVENIEEIIDASDVIMIARGDLGVEIGDAELPGVQKYIAALARQKDKVIITATQMMQSMVDSPIPTRAEVLDVANAVMDGTDAVMLSAETAIGKYPAKVVEAMARVCIGAEKNAPPVRTVGKKKEKAHTYSRTDEAIAKTSIYIAERLGVKAIAALTESGATALWMSRAISPIPIYALTPKVETRRKVTMYRGVHPVSFEINTTEHAQANKEAIDDLVRRNAVRDGDLVIITKGDLMGAQGGTNALKIVKVGEMPDPSEDVTMDT
ncbi:MAG: pyruvate kinase [Gammaproteobacteria bacterium]